MAEKKELTPEEEFEKLEAAHRFASGLGTVPAEKDRAAKEKEALEPKPESRLSKFFGKKASK